MSKYDVLAMLALAMTIITMILFERVDLGMTWDEMRVALTGWKLSLLETCIVICSIAIALIIANRNSS